MPSPSSTTTRAPLSDVVAHMPADALVALRRAEREGAAVDLSGTGPVFYEAQVPPVGGPADLGGVMATVVTEVRRQMRQARASTEDITCVTSALREQVYNQRYDQALAYVLQWVSVAVDEDAT